MLRPVAMIFVVLGACSTRRPTDWRAAGVHVTPFSSRGARGGQAIPATGRPLDGIFDGDGALWIAGDGGLVEPRAARTITWADGLGATGIGALATLGGHVVAGGDDGSLSEIDHAVVRVEGVRAPIVDAASWRGRVVFATRGDGIVAWDGRHASRALAGTDATAIAASDDASLAVGTAEGDVFMGGPRTFRRVARGDAVTSLAWDGAALWIARASGLERLDAGGSHRVVPGLAATSIVVAGGVLYAAEDGGGVVAIDADGRERDLGGARASRLRVIAGEPIAFGDGAAWRVGDSWTRLATVPTTLASGRVTSLARDGDSIWVGTDAGVDVLDVAGHLLRHLDFDPGDVRALARGPDGMLIATSTALLDLDDLLREGEGEGALRPLGAGGDAIAELAGRVAIARAGSVSIAGDDRTWPVAARALAWGAGGNLFAGGDAGLSRLLPDSDEPPVLIDPRPVAALAQSDALWIAGPGRPVARWSGASLVESGPPIDGRALAVAGGVVYVGTDDGVRALEGDRWSALDLALPTPRVTSLLATEDALWIGTSRGLLRVDRRAGRPSVLM
jgi:hypothetical protein